MKILIIGAGSIGIYLGVFLEKNNDVTLLGRRKLKALGSKISIGERMYNMPKKLYKFPRDERYDFIFITSKLYDLKENLKLIIKNKLKSKYLISIQNGIVEESLYKHYIRNSKFTSISVFEGFRLDKNKLLVSHSAMGWRTDKSEAGLNVKKLISSSGIKCVCDEDLEETKAEKAIMNCSINVLSATQKKTFFELMHNKQEKQKIDLLFNESYNVLSKMYKLKRKEILKKEFYSFASGMKHYSSTYQDAIAGKTSEAKFLNGLIVRLGKKVKVATHENKKILKEFFNKYPKSK